MSKLATIFVALAVIISFTTLPCLADNVEDLLNSAKTNYSKGKYFKALEDIEWAKKEVANKQMQLLKSFLPEAVEGYTVYPGDGGSALGIQSVSKRYEKEEQSVEITIMSTHGNQGAGGLGAIMGMAAAFESMDANVNSEMVIVDGRKGQFNKRDNSDEGTLTFNLDKAVVQIKTYGFDNSSEAKKFAEMLKFDDIEQAFM